MHKLSQENSALSSPDIPFSQPFFLFPPSCTCYLRTINTPLKKGVFNICHDFVSLGGKLQSMSPIKHILTTISSGQVSLEKEPSSNMTSQNIWEVIWVTFELQQRRFLCFEITVWPKEMEAWQVRCFQYTHRETLLDYCRTRNTVC